jgi:hypothetical protein
MTRLSAAAVYSDVASLRLGRFTPVAPSAARVTRLSAVSPKASTKLRLLPTVVHDRTAQDVVATMLAIRDTLINREWNHVEPWAINLSQLDQRLMRLAGGKP